MNADERRYFDSLTERVIGAVLEVSNGLGAGFLEKVYERALLTELSLRGIRATTQASFSVTYKGCYVGEYFADILVEDVLVVELKCVEHLGNEHIAQCLNYLRASGRTVCLLVNFQKPKVEWKRIVHGFPESIEAPTPTEQAQPGPPCERAPNASARDHGVQEPGAQTPGRH
jgi:GxxExxY protein